MDKISDRQRAFRELRFGMFIHYNMATYHDCQWVTGYPSPATFKPGVRTIDTDAWADAAKAAGMTYAVLTTQHVAGFCLWPSKLTDYTVVHPDCSYQQDLVGQFVESFTSRGLKVGFYYLWRHPGFGDPAKHKAIPPECDPATHTLEQMNGYQLKQIAELLEMYPQCFYVWNDGLDPDIMPAADARRFFDQLNPDLVASGNWWDWSKKGEPYLDISIKEMRDLPDGNTRPAETCWTLEDSWFWQAGTKTRPAEKVIEHMARALARNSNFLLNVGPDPSGQILPSSVDTLAEIGRWWASQHGG